MGFVNCFHIHLKAKRVNKYEIKILNELIALHYINYRVCNNRKFHPSDLQRLKDCKIHDCAVGIHEMSQFSTKNKPLQLGKQDETGT